MITRITLAAWVLLASLAGVGPTPSSAWDRGPEPGAIADIAVGELPEEGRNTLDLIRKGGPFPYKRDGIVFGNFEKRLPVEKRGYYHEYTVPTPGSRDRGARRIIAGSRGEYYYTDDHYRSFKRIRE